jgi:hypothetical protein
MHSVPLIRHPKRLPTDYGEFPGWPGGGLGVRWGALEVLTNDATWGESLAVPKAKAAWRGRIVISLNPAYTSQRYSVCGVLGGPKPLHIREWQCQSREAVVDRDWNAASNLLVAAGTAATLNIRGDEDRPRPREPVRFDLRMPMMPNAIAPGPNSHISRHIPLKPAGDGGPSEVMGLPEVVCHAQLGE